MYTSNRQKKILANQVDQATFLEEKRVRSITEEWEEAQVKAATIQSALDYAVEQYTQHKDELDEEAQKQVEEQIAARQKEIEEFIMAEKDRYLERIAPKSD